MIEYVVVPSASVWPHHCVACLAGLGRMVDTMCEPAGYGRVYVCESCVTRMARVMGLVRGREMTRLKAASETVLQLEAEVALREDLISRTEIALANERLRADQLFEELAEANGKLQVQAHTIEQVQAASAAMASVA